MLGLIIAIVIIAVVLTAALWVGSLFLQSYFYTQPSQDLYWQAPAAAGALTAFYLLWAMLNVWGVNTKGEVPYGVLWQFNNFIDVVAEPVPEFESKTRNSEPTMFKRVRGLPPQGDRYKQIDGETFWNADSAEYVKFKHGGVEYNFMRDRGQDDFVDSNSGLVMKANEVGRVSYRSTSRFLVYFLLNVAHLAVWIVCLWLILRFQFIHALVLALAMWAIVTVGVFPGLFDRAAAAA